MKLQNKIAIVSGGGMGMGRGQFEVFVVQILIQTSQNKKLSTAKDAKSAKKNTKIWLTGIQRIVVDP